MKDQFKILLVSALAALAIVSASCSLLPTSTTTQTITITSPATITTTVSNVSSSGSLDFSSVVAKVEPSVVQVETDMFAGSGWVVV
jgi:hypothetical protein